MGARGGVGKGGRGGRGGMKGGAKVVIEGHRHDGIFIARGKEDALVTKNMVPGESVYGEKRVSVEAGEVCFWCCCISTCTSHVHHLNVVMYTHDGAHASRTPSPPPQPPQTYRVRKPNTVCGTRFVPNWQQQCSQVLTMCTSAQAARCSTWVLHQALLFLMCLTLWGQRGLCMLWSLAIAAAVTWYVFLVLFLVCFGGCFDGFCAV